MVEPVVCCSCVGAGCVLLVCGDALLLQWRGVEATREYMLGSCKVWVRFYI